MREGIEQGLLFVKFGVGAAVNFLEDVVHLALSEAEGVLLQRKVLALDAVVGRFEEQILTKTVGKRLAGDGERGVTAVDGVIVNIRSRSDKAVVFHEIANVPLEIVAPYEIHGTEDAGNYNDDQYR